MYMDFSLIIKLIYIVLSFILTIIVGILPVLSKSFQSSPKWTGIANAFAGGIFLGVGMLHLLPEADEQIDEYFKDQIIPLSHFLVIVGYSLILLVEKVMTQAHDWHEDLCRYKALFEEKVNAEYVEDIVKQVMSARRHIAGKMTKKVPEFDEEEGEWLKDESVVKYEQKQEPADPIQSYLLLLALSVHSVFEGVAIGVQHRPNNALKLMIAVIVHKQVASLALGISFAKAQIALHQALKMLSVFSFATPLGIIFGMMLLTTDGIVEGIFGALACGTFVYIATSEIIVEEFSISSHKSVKYASYLIGIMCVCLLISIDEDQFKINAKSNFKKMDRRDVALTSAQLAYIRAQNLEGELDHEHAFPRQGLSSFDVPISEVPEDENKDSCQVSKVEFGKPPSLPHQSQTSSRNYSRQKTGSQKRIIKPKHAAKAEAELQEIAEEFAGQSLEVFGIDRQQLVDQGLPKYEADVVQTQFHNVLSNVIEMTDKLATQDLGNAAFGYQEFLSTVFKNKFPNKTLPAEMLAEAQMKIEELNGIITDKDRQIAEMKSHDEIVQFKITNLDEEAEKQKKEQEEIREDKKITKSTLNKEIQMRTDLEKLVNDLQEKRINLEKHIADNYENTQFLKKQIDNRNKTINEQKSQISQLFSQNNTYRFDHQEIESKLVKAESGMDRQLDKVEIANKHADAMKAKYQEAEEQGTKLAAEIVALQLKYEKWDKESQNRETQIVELEERLPVIEHERDMLVERCKSLEDDIKAHEELTQEDTGALIRYRVEEELAKNSIDLKAERKRLKGIIKEQKMTIEKIQWDLSSQEQQWKMYRSHADEAQDQLTKARIQHNIQDDVKSRYKSDLITQKQNAARLAKDNWTLKNENEDYVTKNADQQRIIDNVDDVKDAIHKKYQQKMRSLSDKNDQVTNAFVEETQKRVEWMDRWEREESEHKITKYEVSTLQGKIQEKDGEIKGLLTVQDQLHQQIEKYKSYVADLTIENGQLKKDIDEAIREKELTLALIPVMEGRHNMQIQNIKINMQEEEKKQEEKCRNEEMKVQDIHSTAQTTYIEYGLQRVQREKLQADLTRVETQLEKTTNERNELAKLAQIQKTTIMDRNRKIKRFEATIKEQLEKIEKLEGKRLKYKTLYLELLNKTPEPLVEINAELKEKLADVSAKLAEINVTRAMAKHKETQTKDFKVQTKNRKNQTKIAADYFDQEAAEVRVLQEAAKAAIETEEKKTQTVNKGGIGMMQGMSGNAVLGNKAGSARPDFCDYIFNEEDDEKPKKKGYRIDKELGLSLQQNVSADLQGSKSPLPKHLFRKNKNDKLKNANMQIENYKAKKLMVDRSMVSVGYSTKELTNLLLSKEQNASMPNSLNLDGADTDSAYLNHSVDITNIPASQNDTFENISQPSSLSGRLNFSTFESRWQDRRLQNPSAAYDVKTERQIIAKSRPTALRAKARENPIKATHQQSYSVENTSAMLQNESIRSIMQPQISPKASSKGYFSTHSNVSPAHRREISVVIPKQKEIKATDLVTPRNPPRMTNLPVIPPLRSHQSSTEVLPWLEHNGSDEETPSEGKEVTPKDKRQNKTLEIQTERATTLEKSHSNKTQDHIPRKQNQSFAGRVRKRQRSNAEENAQSTSDIYYEVPNNDTYKPTGIAAHLKQANSRNKDNFKFN